MKRILCCIIAALYMFGFGAYAFEMTDGEYTDVTSVMTQDSVLDLEVFTDEPEEECYIVLQQPDVTSMALLEDVEKKYDQLCEITDELIQKLC